MTLSALICVLLSCYSYVEIVNSANVLAFYPLPARSHFKTFQPLLEELIKKGHNLTLFSGFSLSDGFQKHYSHINIEKYIINPLTQGTPPSVIVQINRFEEVIWGAKYCINLSENITKSPEMQEFIHSRNHYDLIIVDFFNGADIFFALGNKFNAPVISTTSQSLSSYHYWMLGNPNFASFPDPLAGVPNIMSFVSRAFNLGFQLFSILFHEFHILPQNQMMVEKYFNFEKENVPSIEEVMKNISVSFVNSHYSLGSNKPDLPNVVNVAGIHFPTRQPLPDNLQKFMDEAEHGVVYFSFGSSLNTGLMHQLGRTIIDILKVLPQNIVVKWDQSLSPYVSKNILIDEWFPQSDILSHPNCRLFITHGGYLSLLESLNASVPVIGIPFIGDQYYNLAMVEQFELGMKIEYGNIPSELPGKIDEVLKNPKYKNNMWKRSSIFRNRLTSPLDTAMYWVDHVLQHKDTSHLKPASVRLAWYELYSLDVLGILFVVAGTAIYALKVILGKLVFSVLVLATKIQTWLTIKSRQRLSKNNLKIE